MGPAVKGIQSNGVLATAKHYILNNQEHCRGNMSADVDERTIQEIYSGFDLSGEKCSVSIKVSSCGEQKSRKVWVGAKVPKACAKARRARAKERRARAKELLGVDGAEVLAHTLANCATCHRVQVPYIRIQICIQHVGVEHAHGVGAIGFGGEDFGPAASWYSFFPPAEGIGLGTGFGAGGMGSDDTAWGWIALLVRTPDCKCRSAKTSKAPFVVCAFNSTFSPF